jgi:zinc transport system permease protein
MDILAYPFMQRALITGLLVGIMTSLLGVLVVLRRAAFFGDAVAHASLGGVAIGVLTGWNPLLTATAVGVGIATSLHVMERHTRLALDTVLGFTLPFFMAIGVLLLSLKAGYQPELVSFLFGSILTVSRDNLLLIAVIAVLMLVAFLRFRSQLIFAAFDEEAAQLSGIRVNLILTGYYILLALVIIAKMLARSLTHMFVLAPILGLISVSGGIVCSYYLDLPSGPAIVVLSGLLFLGVALWRWATGALAGGR